MVKKITSVEFEVGDRVVQYTEPYLGPGTVTGKTNGGGVFVTLDEFYQIHADHPMGHSAYGTGHDNVTAWFKPKEER